VWADIENIVNEAALQVAKTNREELENHDFEYALEKVIMWPEKKVKSMKENEKKIVAYHELWHAVTWHLLDNTDPIEKISIVRRWHALGVTWTTPEEDKNLYSKAKFLDEIVSLLWGRAAEEVFFGKEEITTWASNDLERATEIVKSMILKYGMDDDFGPINYLKEWEEQWWTNPYSENVAQEVDKKIKDYLQSSYKKAKAILKANEELINKMANILLEKEYLSSEEFLEMMKEGKKI
jgi:cell division protease FtsH